MDIRSSDIKVGELTSEGLIKDINDPRLAEIAKDVLENGIEMLDYVFHEEYKSEMRTSIVTHDDDEYPMVLWGHLHKLGYEVEDFPSEDVKDLEKSSDKFVGMGYKMTVALPYGAKKYGLILEQQIRNTLKYAIQKAIAKWKMGMTIHEMASLYNKQLDKWLDDLLGKLKPMAWNIMQTGLAGTGLNEEQFSNAHKLAMGYLEDNPHSILNAVKTLNETQKAEAIKVLDEAFKGELPWDLKRIRSEIMVRADVSATHAELIARTEMTKISNMGRIFAWESDPLRDDYDYHYVPTRDSRTKGVSLELAGNGPYSFDQIRALWLNPVSPTTGENDVFNNRCGVTRTRKRSL